jgi:hypothetical protein
MNAARYAAIVRRLSGQRRLNTALQHGLIKLNEQAGAIDADILADEIIKSLRAASSAVDTWTAYTLADAYAPREPTRYVVPGLFRMPSLNIVYGAPGTLKSFLLADLAVCVAAGLDWLPALPGDDFVPKRTTQCPAMWLDFDNGIDLTRERFGALGKTRGVPGDVSLSIYSMPRPWLDARHFDAMADLAERVIDRHAGLVVIDNLGTVSGDADENSTEMVSIMSNLRQLAENTGAAVVVIHHQRKGNGLAGRAGDNLRGSSCIEAALDLALCVEREEGSDSITIKSTKTRGKTVRPFGARFMFESDAQDELIAAKFFGEAVEDTHSDKAIDGAILNVLQNEHPLNQSALVKTVQNDLADIGINRIRERANALVRDGRLRATSGTHGARNYDLS